MTAETLLEKLKRFYSSTFDLEESHSVAVKNSGTDVNIQDKCFALYGHFNVDSSRYVLSKKAKLWEANCQEHLFVDVIENDQVLTVNRIEHLDRLLKEEIEPAYIRGGEKYPPANHMYSYITVVIITDEPLDTKTLKYVQSYRFEKTYRFNLRGYMETRLVAVSTADKTVTTNRAGKPLVKAYHQLIV